jgi:hypothetical protein
VSGAEGADDEYNYERFKWTILADAATEGVQHLWEPLWSLRGSYEIPGLSEAERQRVAERALREMYSDDLINFFKEDKPGDIDDPASRLGADEVAAALASDWWREPDKLLEDHPNIVWYATDKGEATYMNAPDHIRAFWERRVQNRE